MRLDEGDDMTLKTFLTVAAAIGAVFGLGFLLAPAQFFAPFGVVLNSGGELIARIFGLAALAIALIYWWVRNETGGTALRAVLRASALYNAASAVPIAAGMMSGVSNQLGWIPMIVNLLLAAGFFHFGFRRM
jgi:uncharacterized protein YjeT (DUF2065 family)